LTFLFSFGIITEMNLVIDGSTLTFDAWQKMYPPYVAECKQLPGTQLPYWYYEWNFCNSCATVLHQCKHNPFAVDGAITRARRAGLAARRLELATAPTEVKEAPTVPQPITKRPEASKAPLRESVDRAPGQRGRIKRTVDVTPALVTKALKLLRKGEGGGMVAIANEANVNPAELSAALKKAGFIPQRGRKKAA
jgi:hypothetical protein